MSLMRQAQEVADKVGLTDVLTSCPVLAQAVAHTCSFVFLVRLLASTLRSFCHQLKRLRDDDLLGQVQLKAKKRKLTHDIRGRHELACEGGRREVQVVNCGELDLLVCSFRRNAGDAGVAPCRSYAEDDLFAHEEYPRSAAA